MILERPLDYLMQEIRRQQLMDVRVREVGGKGLPVQTFTIDHLARTKIKEGAKYTPLDLGLFRSRPITFLDVALLGGLQYVNATGVGLARYPDLSAVRYIWRS